MKRLKQLFSNKKEVEVSTTTVEESVNNEEFTITLLGTGGSGKSAIYRKSRLLSSSCASGLQTIVYDIIIEIFFSFKFHPENLKSENYENYVKCVKPFIDVGPQMDYTKNWNIDVGNALFNIYWDPAFQEWLFKNRNIITYLESVEYFMKKENFDRILDKNTYVLTDEDMFFATFRTTGSTTGKYDINNPNKIIVDTGGQFTERKKWAGILSDYPSCVIGYTISLSEFDQSCYENHDRNRFEDSLSAFKNCFETNLFENKQIYLIFGKLEVLKEKVKNGIKFSEFVSDFNGNDENEDEIVEFIVKKYMDMDVKNQIVKHFVISARNDQQVFEMLNEIFHTASKLRC